MENNKKEIAKFYEQIFSDTKLKEKIVEKAKAIANEEDFRILIREEIMPLMKRFKVNFSEEELLEYEEETLKKLSKKSLENVSGGASMKPFAIGALSALSVLALTLGVGLSANAMDNEPPSLPAMQGKQPQIQEISFSYLMYDAMDGSSALYNENYVQANKSVGEIITPDSEDETIDGFIYNGTFVDSNTSVDCVVEDRDNILVVVRNAGGQQLDVAQIWDATKGERIPQTIQAFALNAETGEIRPTCLNRYPGELISNLFESKINEELGMVDTAIYNGENLEESEYDEVRELNTTDNPPILLIFNEPDGFDIDNTWKRFFTSLVRVPVTLFDFQNKTAATVGLWGIKDKPIADLEEFINDSVSKHIHNGTILDPSRITVDDLLKLFDKTGVQKITICINEPKNQVDTKKEEKESQNFQRKIKLSTSPQSEALRIKDLKEMQKENKKKFFRNANKETTNQYLARITGNTESAADNPPKSDTVLSNKKPPEPSCDPLPIWDFGQHEDDS